MFHVGCAWAASFRFGFQFELPMKRKNVKELETTTFKGGEGMLRLFCWRKEGMKADCVLCRRSDSKDLV